jgi:hypothetical protein
MQGRGVKLITNLYLVMRLRMRGAIYLFPCMVLQVETAEKKDDKSQPLPVQERGAD